jgi:putative membrane protein
MSDMSRNEKILILCVDRDNDIGIKTGVKGPIVGRENIIRSATKMGLADPEDSDFNSMFQAARIHDEMKKKYRTEVAILTGDKNVGVTSDRKISRQLDEVLKKFPADYALLVTDGAEDEHTMPIIQSKLPILSVNRVVVKQAEKLESTYYKIKDFINESMENPKYSRLIFGLPAMILILLGIFGVEGGRIIMGIIGAYLLVKGFKLEKYIFIPVEELQTSFTRRRLAFFTYIVAIAFGILAAYRGYQSVEEWLNVGIFESAASFISASVYYFFLAGTIAWVGKAVSSRRKKISGKKLISVPIFGFAVSLVLYNSAEMILGIEFSLLNFIFAIIFGFALIFLALLIEWKV